MTGNGIRIERHDSSKDAEKEEEKEEEEQVAMVA